MSEFNIEVQGGSSVRLTTAGKYCDRDIIVTASGGGGAEEIENIIDQSGVLDSTDGTVTEKVEQLIDTRFLFNNAGGINFFRSNIEYVTMDCSRFVFLYYCFNSCRSLKEIHLSNTGGVTDWRYAFYNLPLVHTIETIDFSGVLSATYWTTHALPAVTKFRVAPNSIKVSVGFNMPNLDSDSVDSIVDGLMDSTGLSTKNLTLSSKTVISESQIQRITNKNWNYVVTE